MVKLRALRAVCGDYGTAREGQTFETDEGTAESLEARGLAERVRIVERVAKAFAGAPENKATPPRQIVVVAPQQSEPPPRFAYHNRKRR